MATDLERALGAHFSTSTEVLGANGALAGVVLRGTSVEAEIREAVTKASLDVSMDEVGQFDLEVEDPHLELLSKGIFTERTEVGYLDLNFEIATVEVTSGGAGLGGVRIAARSRGAQRLKRIRGPFVMTNVSPTTFVGRLCEDVGLYFVGESSPVRPQVARLAGETNESSWESAQRLAKELGFVCFEASNLMLFGRPTWLLEQSPAVTVAWSASGDYSQFVAEAVPALGVPGCRRSENAEEGATVEVRVPPEVGRRLRPGQALELRGVPTFDGRYLIKRVGADLNAASPIEVEATTPINPAPEPPQDENPADDAQSPPSGTTSTERGEWRWPTQGTITGRFGDKRPGRTHAGVDIGAATGTRVVAPRAAKVVTASWVSGYGNAIYLDHGDGHVSRYGHLSRIGVRVGQSVGAGEVIGQVGNTGVSSGPHLHFEIRRGGTAIDPLKLLP